MGWSYFGRARSASSWPLLYGLNLEPALATRPDAFSCPPAQTSPSDVIVVVAPAQPVIFDVSIVYAFSHAEHEHTDLVQRPMTTDGSGMLKLNF